jgi:hypothetical protein
LRSCCGCSSARKHVDASRIRAGGRRGSGDNQHVGRGDTDFRTALTNREFAAAEAHPPCRTSAGRSRVRRAVAPLGATPGTPTPVAAA